MRLATVLVAALLAVGVTAGLSWWITAGIEMPYRERLRVEDLLMRAGGLLVTVAILAWAGDR